MLPNSNYANENDLVADGWTPVIFKSVEGIDLNIWYKAPNEASIEKATPAIVFFYGGGFRNRNMAHFKRQGEHLVTLGIHVFLADYRSETTYGGSPFDCVEDAKSAMRYVRSHAANFNIKPDMIAAGGGSAGGHLASACALLSGLNAVSDPEVSSRPDALVLFNPVLETSPSGYAYERVQARWKEISPMHHINATAPPNIIFLGTEDQIIPVETAESWQAKMQALGVRCDLHLYEGRKHGFFNGGEDYLDTVEKMDAFLKSLGYIQ